MELERAISLYASAITNYAKLKKEVRKKRSTGAIHLGFLGACSHGSSDEQFFGALFRDYPFWRVINLFVRQ